MMNDDTTSSLKIISIQKQDDLLFSKCSLQNQVDSELSGPQKHLQSEPDYPIRFAFPKEKTPVDGDYFL